MASGEQKEKSRSLAALGMTQSVMASDEQGEKSRSLAALGMTQSVMASGPSQEALRENEKKIANYEAEPIVLAEDSESADVTADLVAVVRSSRKSLNFYLVFGSPAVSSCCSPAFCQLESGLYSFMALARTPVFLPRSF